TCVCLPTDPGIDSNDENSQSMRSEGRSSQPQIFESGNGSVQYQFKTENGQTGAVTYRVVTVDDSHPTHTVVTPTIVSPTQHSSVALLTAHASNPFGASQPIATSGGTDGPYYVMMAPTSADLISHSTSSIRRAKSNSEGSGGVPRVARDEKRRATHNEVERRRRDKINNWIIKLSKVVPDCQQDHTKQVCLKGQSKGGILAKATEYIQELCAENGRLNEVLKENEILNNELDAIRQQFVDTKNENRRLKALLQKHDIPIDDNY
ncbi:unnamed protein product, partial [Oppiella nova]